MTEKKETPKKTTTRAKASKRTVAEKLKEEEALHFFVRNRLIKQQPINEIQKEWLPIQEKIRKNPTLANDVYEREKLEALVVLTRQSLQYSPEGIANKVKEVVGE